MISHPCPDMCFPDAFRVFVPVGRRGHSHVYSFTLFYSLSLVKRVKTVGIPTFSVYTFALLHFTALFKQESFLKTVFNRWNHWDSSLLSSVRGCGNVCDAVPIGALPVNETVAL